MENFSAPLVAPDEVETRLNQFHHYGYRIRQVFPAGDKFLIFAEVDHKQEQIADMAELPKVRAIVKGIKPGCRIDHNEVGDIVGSRVHMTFLAKTGEVVNRDGWWWKVSQ